jgi:hypothetical protein
MRSRHSRRSRASAPLAEVQLADADGDEADEAA